MYPIRWMKPFLQRLLDEKRGAVAILMAAGMVAFCGVSAVVVDIGYLMRARMAVQAATDAAALAGAQDMNNGSSSTAIQTATSYSGTSDSHNAIPNLTVSMASGYPALRCLTSTDIPCSGPSNANAIVVKQTATVPLFFGKVLGLETATVSATAVAGSAGGAEQPIDVIIVLDTTASMNSNDPNCAASGSTRLACAFTGFRTLLQGFDPALDHVGLMVFPGLRNSSSPTRTAAQNAALEYDCDTTTPTNDAIAKYNQSPLYLIVPLSSDYKIGASLNTGSNLVKAAKGSGGCPAGVTAYGGVGTFYAEAIEQAQAHLAANGRSGVQKMIILLSDGDAGSDNSNMLGHRRNNQCGQAVTAARNATAAGMKVVTIAYGAPTSAGSSCPTDSGAISACETLRQMASTADRFYSNNTGAGSACTSAANPISDLNAIFQHIGTTVGTGARLLPENVS